MAEIINSNLTSKEGLSNIGNKIFYFIYYSVVIIFCVFVFSISAMFLTSSLGESSSYIITFLIFVLLPILPFIFSFILSIIVYKDAKKLKNQGANIESPFLWALITFAFVGLPLYLAFRRVDYKKQIKNKIGSVQTPINNPQNM